MGFLKSIKTFDALAYELYLTGIVPKIVPHNPLVGKVIYDCVEALKHYDKSFIGDDWEKISKNIQKYLDPDILNHYGAVSFKSLVYEDKPYDPKIYEKKVSEVLDRISLLYNRYGSFNYKGFTSFYWPHFHYGGNTYNYYTLADLETRLFLKDLEFEVVAEIGGGNGHLCKEIMSHRKCKYILFDLPEMLTRSQLFLSERFPGRVGGYSDGLNLDRFDILCLPCWMASEIKADLWVSVHALGEMPVSVSKKYVDIASKGKYFLAVSDDVDRTFPNLQITRASEYLKPDMKLVSADTPLMSSYPRVKPYYARYLYGK